MLAVLRFVSFSDWKIQKKILKHIMKISCMCIFKGSVQRKLRWVLNGVNGSVGASDCGAGHSFVVLFRFHLGFTIFPFPVSTTQIIGEFWINTWSGTSDLARHIRSANKLFSRIFLYSLRFAY